MRQLNHMNPNQLQYQRQRGITLVESLVAIVIASLGILGILGVQMRTLSDTSTTVRRAQAVRLIEDLGERMKTNPNAMSNIAAYTSAFSNNPPTPTGAAGCATVGNGCNATQLATYDLAAWKQSVRNTLPLGQASIFTPPAEAGVAAGQRRQLGVMIAWRENERDTTAAYKDDIDATKVRASDGSLSIGGGADQNTNACPDNFICHLQYIPVAGRCAPYAPGTNAPAYYCPGP
ncbi:MAG: type IV pilus modification protein PilV [Acidovorax sp.]|nr:type IV pilus modification protein PilV [Acidovorax sp.]